MIATTPAFATAVAMFRSFALFGSRVWCRSARLLRFFLGGALQQIDREKENRGDSEAGAHDDQDVIRLESRSSGNVFDGLGQTLSGG